MSAPPLVTVADLEVIYHTAGRRIAAVEDVSIRVEQGQSLGIVGESGSGKSTLGLALMRLLPRTAEVSGTITVAGQDLMKADARALGRVRGRTIGLVYQDALAALNPVRRIGPQIAEVMTHHLGMGRRQAEAATIEALAAVGISDPAQRSRQYPHQFSGGMRQRAAIAMALAARPQLLLADEPTTALDVTVQAQILRLLRDIRAERGMSMIVISHDLEVIRETADSIAVMYYGRIVETGRTAEVLANPRHPYTRDLVRSAPTVEEPVVAFIPGAPPRPGSVFAGCAFEPRCGIGHADATCRCVRPPLRKLDGPVGAKAACHYPLGLATARPLLHANMNARGRVS